MHPPTGHRDAVFHSCLAGPRVSRDLSLVALLLDRHVLTLVADPRQLLTEAMARMSVLALEHGGTDQTLELITRLRSLHAELDIILINGGVTQDQVALAFKGGVRDYFPTPYDRRLLAERMDGLARAQRRRTPGAPGGGAGRGFRNGSGGKAVPR